MNISTGRGGYNLEPTTSWLTSDSKRSSDYPPGGEPGALADIEYPVQYISPIAAIYVSNALGCRLPTTREFQAALNEAYGGLNFQEIGPRIAAGDIPGGMPNLRDRRYAGQFDHASAVRGANQAILPYTPDIGSFHPNSGRENVHDFDDGFLWFDHVRGDGNSQLAHLLGNVQEWVYDDPDRITPGQGEPIQDPGLLLRAINYEELGVIGGSALSPSTLPLDQPLPVPRPLLADDLTKYYYADVGFRLVIAGKFDTVAEQIIAATNQGDLDLAP